MTGSSDGVCCLWAPGNLERPLEKRQLGLAVSCADFADDQSAYVGCEAGSVQLATFGGSEPCAALGAHRGRVTCLAAHPASRKGAAASSDTLGLRRHLLASASVDWTCRLRVGSTPLGAPLDHGAHGYVASIAWSPSRAALLCTAASDGCVRLWTAASGQIIGAAEQLSAGALTSVAFSGDGRRVVVGDACNSDHAGARKQQATKVTAAPKSRLCQRRAPSRKLSNGAMKQLEGAAEKGCEEKTGSQTRRPRTG